MKTQSIYSNYFMRGKFIEPVKRKHGRTYPEWQPHRFEIKGGISWRDVIIRESDNNSLLKMIKVQA